MAHTASHHPREATDLQWNMIGRFLPKLPRRQDGRIFKTVNVRDVRMVQ
jgi:hypothetical protein